MRESGRIAREVLDAAGRMVRPGISTDEIDRVAHEEAIARGAYPSPLNYHGFPKSCCTSINEVICHGIPDSTVLKDGDLVNIDITVFYNGFHGDCSEMFFVGDVDPAGQELVRVTYECWQEAINFCKPGRAYKDIGAIIEDYVSKYGYSTVKVRERERAARAARAARDARPARAARAAAAPPRASLPKLRLLAELLRPRDRAALPHEPKHPALSQQRAQRRDAGGAHSHD